AVMRDYRYIILNRPAPPAIGRGLVWHVKAPLDAASMQQAAYRLVGKHDFTSFRALACQAVSPVRTVNHFSVLRCDDQIILDVSARSFLHHQVRNFVGTLKLVGTGMWPVNRVSDVLSARDRRMAGPTAPAGGLTLTRVHYPRDPFAEQQ
ncbi:MAG: tRNA pseudouridine(38-40) synthase TruA, partial [Acidocella sp.]|nr:tRNA pseudouridine(38-40) synthase TruA [Acidocella sp.]